MARRHARATAVMLTTTTTATPTTMSILSSESTVAAAAANAAGALLSPLVPPPHHAHHAHHHPVFVVAFGAPAPATHRLPSAAPVVTGRVGTPRVRTPCAAGAGGTLRSLSISLPLRPPLWSPVSSRAGSGSCGADLLRRRVHTSNEAAVSAARGDEKLAQRVTDDDPPPPPTHRIAIVGGGLAGVTAAAAIARRLRMSVPAAAPSLDATNNATTDGRNPRVEIVVFEGDAHSIVGIDESSSGTDDDIGPRRRHFPQPKWTAATAKNANSVVPGAAMHVMSQRSTLVDIARDTVREWTMLHLETLRHGLHRLTALSTSSAQQHQSHLVPPVLNIDNFEVRPPYFDVHPWRCIGPSATSDERSSFLEFLWHFVPTSLRTGPKEADDRARYIVQLARANRHALLADLDALQGGGGKEGHRTAKFGLGKGFLSLHRSREKAQHAVEETLQFDERAELLSWDRAVSLEPQLRNIPVRPLFAVHRSEDVTADCQGYVRDLARRSERDFGVVYRRDRDGDVRSVERLSSASQPDAVIDGDDEDDDNVVVAPPRFRITTKDGSTYDANSIVLAAGVDTPLLARQVGAGKYCPTYPLRGYSLTIHTALTGHREDDDATTPEGVEPSSLLPRNRMNRPLSVDQMYCSSVGPNMVRFAGFGEIVGFRREAPDVPSVAPRVLTRYARSMFPDAVDIEERSAMQCFRPMSPDDLPIAGGVGAVPGLFLHNGHGTLGWTMSLATAECVAQAVCDGILNDRNDDGSNDDDTAKAGEKMFELPDGTVISRRVLAPDRFV